MRNPKIRRCLAALAMGWFLAGASLAPLRADQGHTPIASPAAIHGLMPLADGWWSEIYGPIETALSRRESMVQFGAVGVLIGLFIIWYRRH
jgi:hypothetical protein